MKKNLKKRIKINLILFVCFVLLTLLTSTHHNVSYATSIAEKSTSSFGTKYTLEEQISFSEIVNKGYEKFIQNNNGEPDYLAGAYIDGFTFTILVNTSPDSVRDEIEPFFPLDNLIIKKASYSLKELEKVHKQIEDELLLKEPGVIGVGVDERNNQVFVEVENSEQMFQHAKQLLDTMILNGSIEQTSHPIIQIRYKNQEYTPMADVQAGVNSYIVNERSNTISTIGFNATRINSLGVTERGFLVAGHAASLYDKMSLNGRIVGGTAWRMYGGKADASFINMNNYPSSGYFQSNRLSKDYKITSYSEVGVVGSVYMAHGMKSGIIAGSVENRSFSFVMEKKAFSDHIRMKMRIYEGDSGAPLVRALSGYNRSIVGLCSGGDNTFSNFSKVTNILNLMNGRLYYE